MMPYGRRVRALLGSFRKVNPRLVNHETTGLLNHSTISKRMNNSLYTKECFRGFSNSIGRSKKKSSHRNHDGSAVAKGGKKGKTKRGQKMASSTTNSSTAVATEAMESARRMAILWRVPPWVALVLLGFVSDLWPLQYKASSGPSMLPTMQTSGEIWLLWSTKTTTLNAFLWWCEQYLMSWLSINQKRYPYRVGHLVLWRDPETNRMACKRVIGLEGDTVQRFGEYVHLYYDTTQPSSGDSHWGIVWDSSCSNLDRECQWDTNAVKNADNDDPYRTLVVPPGHVWLEGDNPPLSIDSRHYGPIPKAWITARVVGRLWPFWTTDKDYVKDGLLKRPIPLDMKDAEQLKQFNLHVIE